MSNINQLLAKALSTTSEEEAMACLRMARKKGKSFDGSSSGEYNGHSAQYWYDKAARYYNEAKVKQQGLTPAQQQQLWSMYREMEQDMISARRQRNDFESEVKKLKAAESKHTWKLPVIGLQLMIIITLLQFIH